MPFSRTLARSLFNSGWLDKSAKLLNSSVITLDNPESLGSLSVTSSLENPVSFAAYHPLSLVECLIM